MTFVKKNMQGFTLIEIMIVVAIVAILGAIAIPSYKDYIQRGKLVTATNQLQSMQSAMEQFYQDNRSYLSSGAFISPCASTGLVGVTSITGWSFSCPVLTATTYTIQASGNQGLTTGFTYDITSSVTSTTAVPSNWPAIPSGNTCFITKKGMTC